MKPPAPRYSFGPFVLDLGRAVLIERDQPVVLTPRAFELLATLVQHAGELLQKDELIKQVWGGTIVEENNLARQVSTLRKVLRERPGQHDYILTVPGVGYRFVAAVTEVPSSDERHPVVPSTPDVRIAPRPMTNRALWFGVLSVVSLVVAITVVLVRQFSRTDGPTTFPRSLAQLTFGPDLQGDPAWSPDGRRVAFASDRQGNSNIWVQELSQTEPIRVTSSPAREWQPDWSPDGGWIVYRSEQDGGGLYIVAAEGGAARQLSVFGTRPRWSPSGDLILFSNATSRAGARKLYVVDPRGGAPREIGADVIEPLTSSIWASVDAAWHPDGRRISVWGRLPEGRWTFATVNVATGAAVYSRLPESGLRDLDRQRVRLGRFVWAPSARFLYFEGQAAETRNIWRVAVEPSTLAWIGTPERLTTDVGEEADLALSPEGTRLAFTVRTQRTSVWALDFDPRLGQLTGHEQAFTTGSAGQVDLDTPRDGSRLAYRSVRAGRSELWEVRTADREERVLLVSNQGSPSSPRWSSDGRSIAYSRPSSSSGSSSGAGRDLLAIMSPEQRREQLITIPGRASFRPSDWSTDGRMILGDCRSPGESMGICLVSLPGRAGADSAMQVLVHDPTRSLFGPRFSPDQRWVSFVAVDPKGSTVTRIYVAPAGGGPWIPITDGRSFDDKARWALDGRTVYFVSDRSGYLNVLGRRFDPVAGQPVGEPFFVTSFDSPKHGLPSNPARIEFSIADGRIFLPITETESAIWVLGDVDK